MLALITCMGGMDVDTTDHIAREKWLLTLVTCMGGVDVDTDHMHGRSGC